MMSEQTTAAPEAQQAVAQVREAYETLRTEIAKVIVGQDDVVQQVLLGMFCRGHVMVEGVPGLAKTLLISTLAKALHLEFNRIQFTPDLMPSDITGTEVIEEDKATGHRELRFVNGPIFSNIILADEINRTPPKTQAALLEAMQERQVTVAGERHSLPDPFFVLATQNPLDQEGTYPLPEAQLDRFMFKIVIGYPTMDEELEVIRRTTSTVKQTVDSVLDGQTVIKVQGLVREVPVADHVAAYALRLVRATRISEHSAENPKPQIVRDYLSWGAGPRACQYLILGAKANAILNGRFHVTPEDIQAVAKPVLRHRVAASFTAEADGVSTDDVIDTLLREIPVEASVGTERRQLDSVVG